MTPPPAADASAIPSSSSAYVASLDPQAANAGAKSMLEDGDDKKAFYALCEEQRRLVNGFLSLQKPDQPETSLETLKRAQEETKRSLEIIREALRRFRLDALSLSYNGGKDCLVLLILYLAALPDMFSPSNSTSQHPGTSHDLSSNSNHIDPTASAQPSSNSSTPRPHPSFPAALASVYIEAPYPFQSLSSFVEVSAATYRLALVRHSGDAGLRAAFAAYCADQPGIEAIMVGTRRSDPHGANLDHFQHTDSGWPAFVRVLPMLEWHYEDIWAFLRALNIEYCELYDQGYTSLGGTKDTRPNPALERADGTFAPAYELIGDSEERLGRDHH